MDTIFHITGGLGKHILSTSIINSYKIKYPEKNIIVSSAYPEIFANNPNVDESLNINRLQYFYKNYILKNDVEIFAQEPYKQSSHILKKSHLIDTWCDMIDIENISPPSLHLNFREIEICNRLISPYIDKPILIFQPFGGPKNQQHAYCWARDIHPNLAQAMVDELTAKYNILHICNPNHPQLNNCVRIDQELSPNILSGLLLYSDRRILIDSCMQHAAACLNLPSLVFWIVTDPNIFGYSLHNNIKSQNIPSKGVSSSYFFDYEISGNVSECPFDKNSDIFNNFEILEIIKKQF
jgi:hypothetical protein